MTSRMPALAERLAINDCSPRTVVRSSTSDARAALGVRFVIRAARCSVRWWRTWRDQGSRWGRHRWSGGCHRWHRRDHDRWSGERSRHWRRCSRHGRNDHANGRWARNRRSRELHEHADGLHELRHVRARLQGNVYRREMRSSVVRMLRSNGVRFVRRLLRQHWRHVQHRMRH